jgi:6-phosphogluconolactonase
MYLVSKLNNTVGVFTLDGVSNMIQEIPAMDILKLEITRQQTISTIGLGANRTTPIYRQLVAEVALSKDGKFEYVSNRDTTTYASDTLAVFSVNPDPKKDHANLTYLGHNATYGKIPRHLSLARFPEPVCCCRKRSLAVSRDIGTSGLKLHVRRSG